MRERIDYRTKKWIFQHLPQWNTPNQLDRLSNIDWDILVVLDACRIDTLRQIADWPVDTAISPASCTPEWLKTVSEHRAFDGTHVISGNPQYEKVDVEIGYDLIESYWKSHWNKKLQTTLPEPILNRADSLRGKKSGGIVAHLQQPHWPYISRLGERWELAYNNIGPWNTKTGEIRSLQVAMQRKQIDVAKAKQAYNASVQSVWKVITKYLGEWVGDGNTVIVTADHGEAFGRLREFGFYEHPCGCNVAPLVKVPWIELHPRDEEQKEMNDIEDRLQALGYA